MFQSKLRGAIMAHVNTKIKTAEAAYQKRLEQHETEYQQDLVSAKQLWLQKQAIALEEIFQGFIKSFLE